MAARHLRHFVQRHPPLRRDDGSLRELFRVWRLAFEARQPFAVLHADTSAQRIAKPGRDAISELHRRQPGRRQLPRVEVDMQLRLVEAGCNHLIHPRQALDLALQREGLRAQRLARRTVKHQDGGREAIRAGDFDHLRIGCVGRQFSRGLVLDFAAQIVGALVELALGNLLEAHQDR